MLHIVHAPQNQERENLRAVLQIDFVSKQMWMRKKKGRGGRHIPIHLSNHQYQHSKHSPSPSTIIIFIKQRIKGCSYISVMLLPLLFFCMCLRQCDLYWQVAK